MKTRVRLSTFPILGALLTGLLGLSLAWHPTARAQPVPATTRAQTADSQTPPALGAWHYTLMEGSTLVKDCPICAGPTILISMRGSFDLRRVDENPLYVFYALQNIDFQADSPSGVHYKISGQGTYRIGGEVALTQNLFLELQVDDGVTNRAACFTNDTAQVDRLWPVFHADTTQTNGTQLETFYLDIQAAPFREIWFSTASGMTSGTRPPPDNHFSGGDLLSFTGRRVQSNAQLSQRLGIMPIVPDIGLDAVDVLPGGEIAFSAAGSIFSETLGPIQEGDLLSNQGRILFKNQELTAAFSPMPVVPDVGLDAVQAGEKGEFLFSIRTNLFSEKLGRTLGHGDLLSSTGRIVRTNQELLARFHPDAASGGASKDYGLDAVYIWPSGEIWFSLEEGFQDQQLGPVQAGDLLSDQGYIIIRNLDLVSAYAPIEDLADFGLDGLVMVTDALPPAPAPHLDQITVNPMDSHPVRIEWEGEGRFFQVEGAPALPGTFEPLSPILTERVWEEETTSNFPSQFFYRLRQW